MDSYGSSGNDSARYGGLLWRGCRYLVDPGCVGSMRQEEIRVANSVEVWEWAQGEPWMNPQAAARCLRVSRWTVNRWASRGWLRKIQPPIFSFSWYHADDVLDLYRLTAKAWKPTAVLIERLLAEQDPATSPTERRSIRQ